VVTEPAQRLDSLPSPAGDGRSTAPIEVQAMLMAHTGKVVFETYPGKNPPHMHVWMSASKTTVGLLVAMLADEGKADLERGIAFY
jgi:CubicO group peptidase (beta-lactamase class C family)